MTKQQKRNQALEMRRLRLIDEGWVINEYKAGGYFVYNKLNGTAKFKKKLNTAINFIKRVKKRKDFKKKL